MAENGNNTENNAEEEQKVEDTEYSTKDDFNIVARPRLIILESIRNMKHHISEIEKLLYELSNTDETTNKEESDMKWRLQANLTDLKKTLKYFKVSVDFFFNFVYK